jgi:bifunctional non-homologous end joining protein LigD
VKPALVAEVAFTEWTVDGKLRHPSFVGIREDKAAEEVVREVPRATSNTSGKTRSRPRHRSGTATRKKAATSARAKAEP